MYTAASINSQLSLYVCGVGTPIVLWFCHAGSLGGAERAAAIAAAANQGLPAPLRPTKELYQEKSLNLTGTALYKLDWNPQLSIMALIDWTNVMACPIACSANPDLMGMCTRSVMTQQGCVAAPSPHPASVRRATLCMLSASYWCLTACRCLGTSLPGPWLRCCSALGSR